MQNNFFTKTDNIFINKLSTINLTALSIFLIYFLSITLLPIANDIINTRQNNLFANRNNNINSYTKVLKLKTKTNNSASTVDTTTYINNGQMLARQIDNNNLQSYVNDAKGSILKLNSADKTNNQTYSYDAYGVPIANIKTTKSSAPPLNVIPNPFQYNDERFDNNTALQYLRARFYNPNTKRFINQDNYNLLNKFGYVDDNPIMASDPEGHTTWNDFTKLVSDHSHFGALAGIVVIVGVAGTALTLYLEKRFINKSIEKQLKKEGLFWQGEKVLVPNDVKQIFVAGRKCFNRGDQEVSCSHESILWGLAAMGKPVSMSDIKKILLTKILFSKEKYRIIGKVTIGKMNASDELDPLYASVLETFNKNPEMQAALIFTDKHVAFWQKLTDTSFAFSYWAENSKSSQEGQTGIIKVTRETSEEFSQQFNDPVLKYLPITPCAAWLKLTENLRDSTPAAAS